MKRRLKPSENHSVKGREGRISKCNKQKSNTRKIGSARRHNGFEQGSCALQLRHLSFQILTIGKSPHAGTFCFDQGDEFTALTAGQGKFTSVDLSGYVLGALTVISNKLINNTDINIVSKVEELMTEAFRVKLERELIHGTSGKMTGAVSTTNKMTLTTYTLAGITFDVLIEMQAMIPQIYQSNAMWIMSNKTFTALRKTKNSQNEYLMKDIETGFGWKILGSPVYISDAMDEATKQEGYPVLYGDFSGMALKIAKQLELQVLNEKYADKNAKGVVGWLEADSKVENNQKIAVLQSGKQNG